MKETQAAGWLVAGWLAVACGWAAAAKPLHVKGTTPTQKKFLAWQRELLRKRSQPTEQMKRIFYRKITVPPPVPAGQRADGSIWRKIRYHTRYDYSLFDPMGLLPSTPDLGVGSGDPTVTVSLKAHGGLARLGMVEGDIALFGIGPESNRAFGDAKVLVKAGFLGRAGPAGTAGEAACSFEMTGRGKPVPGSGGKLSGSYGIFSAGVGLATDGKAARVQVSGGVGKEIPDNPYVQAGLKVEADVSMPVVIEDVYGTAKHGVARAAVQMAGRITRLVRDRIRCPYCKGKGRLTCRTCWNRGTVTCTNCGGRKTVDCPGCRNGRVSCPTTQTCRQCSGYGRVPCRQCGRTGRVNVQKQYTRQETRSYKVPYQAGFTSDNTPIVRYRTEYRTVDIPYWVTESVLCSTCGGVGWLGRCNACSGTGKVTCRTCSGRGWYTHRRCGGTGRIPCPKCRGSGRIPCPSCHGRKITCPLCGGDASIGGGS